MSKKLNFLLLSFLVSTGVFVYLSYHHYTIKLGLGGVSLCQISEKVNCDIAALSQYAEIFSIPIAVLGLSYSLVMLGVFLFAKLEWLEETPAFATIVKGVTAFSALVSVFLLIVSITQLKAYCPFCIISYVLSFIIVFLTWSLYAGTPLTVNFSALLDEKGLWGSLFAIPVIAWFISGSVRDNYGLDQLEKVIPEKISLWQNSPVVNFDNTLGLVKGNNEPNAPTVVEFADFKCPHCKSAATTLKNFISGNKHAKIVFKPYPLDGVCNPHISMKGDGTRCELAGWALCAEKLFSKGWDVHYWIFDHQEELSHQSDLSSALSTMTTALGVDPEKLKTCATSTETYDIIKKMTDEGEAAKISGTPSIFVNGKKLEHGQFIDVLAAVFKTLK